MAIKLVLIKTFAIIPLKNTCYMLQVGNYSCSQVRELWSLVLGPSVIWLLLYKEMPEGLQLSPGLLLPGSIFPGNCHLLIMIPLKCSPHQESNCWDIALQWSTGQMEHCQIFPGQKFPEQIFSDKYFQNKYSGQMSVV